MKKTYAEQKQNARQRAIDWQEWQAGQSLSQGEYADFENYFTRLGRRFGLLREFKENAII